MSDFNDLPPPPAAGDNSLRFAILSDSELQTWLAEDHTSLTSRRDELTKAVDDFIALHPKIEDEDVNAAALETLEMLRKHFAFAEEKRVDAKEPFLRGGRVIDAWFKGVKGTIETAANKLKPLSIAYSAAIAAERKRLADIEAAKAREAARKAEEEAAATATAESYDSAIELAKKASDAEKYAASPAALSRQTGVYGSKSSLRKSWKFRIVDANKVPRHLCVPSDPLINAAMKANKGADGKPAPIDGLEFYEETDLRTRS